MPASAVCVLEQPEIVGEPYVLRAVRELKLFLDPSCVRIDTDQDRPMPIAPMV